mgnify:CR=1 FL=1
MDWFGFTVEDYLGHPVYMLSVDPSPFKKLVEEVRAWAGRGGESEGDGRWWARDHQSHGIRECGVEGCVHESLTSPPRLCPVPVSLTPYPASPRHTLTAAPTTQPHPFQVARTDQPTDDDMAHIGLAAAIKHKYTDPVDVTLCVKTAGERQRAWRGCPHVRARASGRVPGPCGVAGCTVKRRRVLHSVVVEYGSFTGSIHRRLDVLESESHTRTLPRASSLLPTF